MRLKYVKAILGVFFGVLIVVLWWLLDEPSQVNITIGSGIATSIAISKNYRCRGIVVLGAGRDVSRAYQYGVVRWWSDGRAYCRGLGLVRG